MTTMIGTGRRPNVVVRLAAVITASLLIWLAMGWLADTAFAAWPPNIAHTANAVVVLVLAVPMVIAARRYLDRRPWAGLRVTGPGEGWRPLVVGAVSWLVPGVAGIVLAVSRGWVQISVTGPVTTLVGTVGLLVVLVLVFEAFPEEVIMRGYVYRNLAAAMPPWSAVAVQTLLFTLFGTVLWTVTAGWTAAAEQAGMFVGMGAVLGCIRVMTGNVWACIGYHLVFQVAAQLLLGDRHSIVTVDGAQTLTLVAFATAFAIGPIITALLSPNDANWSRPEPDGTPTRPTGMAS
ncbi:CPBP family intramembrane metalloprotease [Egibacter rhizosphaerae]|uniref:CPBP family intramembrane metalloprotease n=1 Tax=Egibacter rhizosphaerae TaxID=1670831 RepID=A0A411YCB6_9ACTN|nr:type II CAAX endopeptidase family protein [Egibacter rhizosphaerae]QBI18815.1 CPBP family intramembrane metalloprotease [Egibacter rhizosphaerae]